MRSDFPLNIGCCMFFIALTSTRPVPGTLFKIQCGLMLFPLKGSAVDQHIIPNICTDSIRSRGILGRSMHTVHIYRYMYGPPGYYGCQSCPWSAPQGKLVFSSLSSFAPEIWSGRPVPRVSPFILHTQDEPGALLSFLPLSATMTIYCILYIL